MKVLGLAGWSGAGKTTLLIRLIPELNKRGISVSTLKHAHHSFDIDQPGKDSFSHRQAGAKEVLVASANRWALMHEHRGEPEPDAHTLINHLSPVDLVLIEGFKKETHPKLEIYRPELGKPLLAEHDPQIIAIASSTTLPLGRVPVLPLDDTAAIADFVGTFCQKGASWPN